MESVHGPVHKMLLRRRWCQAIAVLGLIAANSSASDGAKTYEAADHTRQTIYHSSQTPGYTCWTGMWIMPDRSLMVTFKEATGPVEGRPLLLDLQQKLGLNPKQPGRDFTGLKLANVYLRSLDGGKTWQKTAEDFFPGPFDRAAWGGSHCALSDSAIIRAVDGSQLPLVDDLPRRIFFQRSSDLGRTWGAPEVPPQPARPVTNFLGDFGDCISRVRRLSDGRLMATGVIRPDATNRRTGLPLVLLSNDEGRNWLSQSIELTAEQEQPGAWNEWDWAEMTDGVFLCVFRRTDPKQPPKQFRWQGILMLKDGAGRFENYGRSSLEHSGHPELIAAREGIVLHIATTGIHWAADGRSSWQELTFPGAKEPYRSRYYPKSVQTDDGWIFVVSHVGADDAYGQRDQAIVLDRFRLVQQ